ncbi:MAG: hypothetical protein IKE75_02730 [Bacilli bacterium]|nr:hypothetical protein [Bacilli bacterium]
MTIQLLIFIIALGAIIGFFKNFNACVYFTVMVDIFLRIVTYLTAHYFRTDAFSFLGEMPSSVLEILNGVSAGIINEILVIIYIIVYIIFEVLLIRFFIQRKF